jgi:hypothetical protein
MKALLRRLFKRSPAVAKPVSDVDRARQLIAAVDAGGIPLDQAIINRIATGFGLEVSRTARTEETIERIRAALGRCDSQ